MWKVLELQGRLRPLLAAVRRKEIGCWRGGAAPVSLLSLTFLLHNTAAPTTFLLQEERADQRSCQSCIRHTHSLRQP